MSLGGEINATWDQMKQVFIAKYQDYCRTKDKREEFLKMMQKYDEILKDFVERLLYNVHKIILLWGIREDCLDILNLLGKGDISKESFDDIVDLCRRYSRGYSKTCIRERDVFTWAKNSSTRGATHAYIGNLLENFKIDMMSSISSELDVLRGK